MLNKSLLNIFRYLIMKNSFKSVIASVSLFLCGNFYAATTIAAVVTYEYEGNPFDVIQNPDGILPSGVTNVSGYITLSTPLTANMALTNIEPSILSFSFTDGATVITNTHPELSNANIWIETDVNADISNWYIVMSINDVLGYQTDIETHTVTRIHDQAYDTGSYFLPGATSTANLGLISDHPGVWASYVVPIPPAVYLFGTGLIGVLGVIRRKRMA